MIPIRNTESPDSTQRPISIHQRANLISDVERFNPADELRWQTYDSDDPMSFIYETNRIVPISERIPQSFVDSLRTHPQVRRIQSRIQEKIGYLSDPPTLTNRFPYSIRAYIIDLRSWLSRVRRNRIPHLFIISVILHHIQNDTIRSLVCERYPTRPHHIIAALERAADTVESARNLNSAIRFAQATGETQEIPVLNNHGNHDLVCIEPIPEYQSDILNELGSFFFSEDEYSEGSQDVV